RRKLPLSQIRAATCLIAVTLCILPALVVQMILIRLPGRGKNVVPKWFFRAACLLFGIHVDVRGKASREQPVLFVANHISWLDIFTLGSLMTSSFVARADLEYWLLFGWLARLRRTIF